MPRPKEREPTEGAEFKHVEGIVDRDKKVKGASKYSHMFTVIFDSVAGEPQRVCGRCGAILGFTGEEWESDFDGDGSCLVLAHSP
jgi:hypothetical protein